MTNDILSYIKKKQAESLSYEGSGKRFTDIEISNSNEINFLTKYPDLTKELSIPINFPKHQIVLYRLIPINLSKRNYELAKNNIDERYLYQKQLVTFSNNLKSKIMSINVIQEIKQILDSHEYHKDDFVNDIKMLVLRLNHNMKTITSIFEDTITLEDLDFTDEEIQELERYYKDNYSIQEIANYFSKKRNNEYDRNDIDNYISFLRIPRREARLINKNAIIPTNTPEVIENTKIKANYFSNIDIEYKAWMLGFFFNKINFINSKGIERGEITLPNTPVYKKLYTFIGKQLNLQLQGKAQYKGGSNFISGGREVVIKPTTNLEIKITNQQIISDLKTNYVVSDKRNATKIPKLNPLLIRHFLRGLLDAKGHLEINNEKQSVTFIGSQPFLKALGKLIGEYGIINGNLRHIIKKDIDGNNIVGANMELEYGRREEVINLTKILYLNSNIFNDSKYLQFMKIKSMK